MQHRTVNTGTLAILLILQWWRYAQHTDVLHAQHTLMLCRCLVLIAPQAAIEALDPEHLCTTYWHGKEQR